MLDMAVSGGPKCAGKKQANGRGQTPSLSLSTKPLIYLKIHQRILLNMLRRISMHFTISAPRIHAMHVNHQSSGLATLNQGHTRPGFDSSSAQSSAPHNQIGLNNILHSAVGLSNGGFLPSHGQYPSSFNNQNIALTRHLVGENPSVIYSSQQQQSYAGQVVGMPRPNTSSLQLKSVAGTKVTRCYG